VFPFGCSRLSFNLDFLIILNTRIIIHMFIKWG
jgi:hypothetical protein